jgi:deoxycytidine triphosphate deaminase
MLLSYNRLCELHEQGVIICDPKNINGASIDITLGDEMLLEVPPETTNVALIDPRDKNQTLQFKKVQGSLVLTPGSFALATTNEVFNLPDNIACEYKLKSSLARSGLQHMLAGWCDPGWNNSKLTMEFYNATKFHHILLTPGMKIGQMVFFECDPVPADKSYAVTGQYNNQATVTANKGAR